MDNLKKLEMVIDTFAECAKACDKTEGLSILHFSSIPEGKQEKNHGLVCGTPETLILTLMRAMATDDRIRKIVMSAAASYKMFSEVFSKK